MKIIHTADLHLDSKIDTLPSEKSKIRREEIISTFERLCDYAKQNLISVVILAGDMFDSAKISNKTLLRVFNTISNARETDFLYLSGNHDEKALLYDREDLPKNLKFFNDLWTSFQYENVIISGINFTNTNIATYTDTLDLDEDNINIVVLHGQTAEYKSKDDAEVISLPKLKNKNIDYLALGHIHSYAKERLDLRGEYVYSGCLDGRGFDELGEKGFSLIEIENDKIKSEFVPFSSRIFYNLGYTVDENQNWYSQIDKYIAELKNNYSEKSVVKISLSGEISPSYEVDLKYFTDKLNEFFFFAKIYDRTSLKITLEDYQNDKSIVGEFVRTVLAEKIDKELSNKILKVGLNALTKKEID